MLSSGPCALCDLGPKPALCRASRSRRVLPQGSGLAALRACSADLSPQGAYSTFVYSYAVEKPLSVGHKMAGYLPSLFWGFITLGQLVSIPVSSRVKPASMVFINVVSGLLSLLGASENHSLLALPRPQASAQA